MKVWKLISSLAIATTTTSAVTLVPSVAAHQGYRQKPSLERTEFLGRINPNLLACASTGDSFSLKRPGSLLKYVKNRYPDAKKVQDSETLDILRKYTLERLKRTGPSPNMDLQLVSPEVAQMFTGSRESMFFWEIPSLENTRSRYLLIGRLAERVSPDAPNNRILSLNLRLVEFNKSSGEISSLKYASDQGEYETGAGKYVLAPTSDAEYATRGDGCGAGFK